MALVCYPSTHSTFSACISNCNFLPDTHFQVNHLSQMHLILTLLPNIIQTADEHNEARIVLQSSDLHRVCPSSVKFASLDEINTDIGPSYIYNRSKLAQILFVRALVRRLEDGRLGHGINTNVYVNATYPGAVSTEQQKQAEEAYGVAGKVAVAVTRPFMKDPITQGPLPALFAATSPDVPKEKILGKYVCLHFVTPCAFAPKLPLANCDIDCAACKCHRTLKSGSRR